MVCSQLDEWKKTQWEDINTSVIDEQFKVFQKELKRLGKPMRTWDVYTGLDTAIKTFSSLMPLVTQLRSPSMRKHHWKEF
jgi:hypothetical protein